VGGACSGTAGCASAGRQRSRARSSRCRSRRWWPPTELRERHPSIRPASSTAAAGRRFLIWSVKKQGGRRPAARCSGGPTTIVADDAFVYWTSALGIHSAPVGGGATSLLAKRQPLCMDLDAAGSLFWVEPANTASTGPSTAAEPGGPGDRGQRPASCGLALDDAGLTTAPRGRRDQRVVARARKDGTGIVTSSAARSAPAAAAADAKNVYVRPHRRRLAIAKDGRDRDPPLHGQHRPTPASPRWTPRWPSTSTRRAYWNWPTAPRRRRPSSATPTAPGWTQVDPSPSSAPGVDDHRHLLLAERARCPPPQ